MERQKHSCWSCGAIYVDVGRVPLSCPRCGTAKQIENLTFPVALMHGVHWSFVQPARAAEAAFRTGLIAYNQELEHQVATDALDLTLPTWRVRVVFSYRGEDTDAMIEQKAPLTPLALLHQLHLSWGRKLAKVDHHFFEGFNLARAPKGTNPPVYAMRLGS